jgi:hypothetical protein
MPEGAPRLLTRTRQRAHHRSPAVYVRSAVGSRMSKHRALAHPPSAPTICEVVRLPDYVQKFCASTDGHSPFAPMSCLTGATVLAKPTSDAVVALAPPGCTGISLPARERCVASKPRRAASAFRGSMVVDSASRPDTTRSLTYASLGPLYNRAVRGVWGEQACAHGGSACTAFEAVRLSDQTYVASIRQAICTVTSDARLRSGEHHGILRTRPQRRRTRFGRPRCRPRTTEGSSPPRKECLDVDTNLSGSCVHTTRKRDWMVGIAHGNVRPPSPRMVGWEPTAGLQQAGRGEARPSVGVGPRPRVQ